MSAEKNILHNKDGIVITKINEDKYDISFHLANRNIILPNVINFNLMKLIHELNKDVCEQAEIQVLDENTALLTILLKNLFEDLGLAQKYACLQVKKTFDDVNQMTVFQFQTVDSFKASWLPEDIELNRVENVMVLCKALNPHSVVVQIHIEFPPNRNLPAFVEKMSVMTVNKIINRLKQFIENVKF
jgi:hypothetical protein